MTKVEEIYEQTQNLARLIMKQRGFYSDYPIHHLSDGRALEWWRDACEIMELLYQHEMSDVVDEYCEIHNVNYEAIEDKEALYLLSQDIPVFVKSGRNGNNFGYKKIESINNFLETCYQHCTVYKN